MVDKTRLNTLVIQKRLTNNPKNPYTEETDYILTLEMAKHYSKRFL